MSVNLLQDIRALTDYSDAGSLVNRLRNRRLQFFETRLRALGKQHVTLLDVGGYERFWTSRGYDRRTDLEIVLLNLQAEETHARNMRSVAGDACDMRAFANGEFDIVFSNSVIEHLHTFERQQAMAREVLRVGRHHFVQTPNRWFPIEPHYLLPCFQFLPRPVQRLVLTRTPLSRGGRMSDEAATEMLDEIRLLSSEEFRNLFPESRFYRERFMGMTKSFTAYTL